AVQSLTLHANESGIGLHRIPMKNVTIINNIVGRNLGPSIGGNSIIDGLIIDNNTLSEPEMAPFSDNSYRTAILLTGEMTDVTITYNKIKDVELPNNVEYGMVVNCDSTCTVENNEINPTTIPIQY